jgi:hypothetical protein
MPMHRWLSRTTAWIATLAVCFGALAPTLSQAALQARGEGAGHWVQICSASGITWVRADTGEAGGEHQGTALTCPWGVITGGAAGLPPAHALLLPDAEPQPVPLARAQRSLADPIRLHAPARAPPSGT